MIKLTYEFENVDQLWEHIQTVKGITVKSGEPAEPVDLLKTGLSEFKPEGVKLNLKEVSATEAMPQGSKKPYFCPHCYSNTKEVIYHSKSNAGKWIKNRLNNTQICSLCGNVQPLTKTDKPVKESKTEPKAELQPINCAICGTPFMPKSKRARLCSKQCANIEQNSKKDPAKIDEMLARIKKECPVSETPRPTFYRELL